MSDSIATDARRQLPSVDRLLKQAGLQSVLALYGRERVRVQARLALEELRLRAEELSSEELVNEMELLSPRVEQALTRLFGTGIRRVLNATGIFLHTNLGRAPLPAELARALPRLLDAYCDLEMDLDSGRRGNRNARIEPLLASLTGAESGLVTNNNAAALLLSMASIAAGGEVIVSRGELVEIGGSFRIPDILATAGARLVEVGTTNRTRPEDYERAIRDETSMLLKVYPSNYRITGFVRSVEPAELVPIARRHGLPLLVDEGSGLLYPHHAKELAAHPSFKELIELGCDLVCGSGDKLLGGPQAGLLAGKAELIARCARHPLYRPLRPDRGTLAGLDGVLRMRLAGEPLPLDRMWPETEAHRQRLEKVAEILGAEIVAAEGFLGGGALPEVPIPGEALAWAGGNTLLTRLRQGEPSVVGYLREGRLLLDLRTVDPADDAALVKAVAQALG